MRLLRKLKIGLLWILIFGIYGVFQMFATAIHVWTHKDDPLMTCHSGIFEGDAEFVNSILYLLHRFT